MNRPLAIASILLLIVAGGIAFVILRPSLTDHGSSSEGDLVWERPPIVLISLDTLGARHVSSYGYDRATSPNLDLFADQAVRFARAQCQSSGTLPSHLSLLSSLLPPQFRITRADGKNHTQGKTRLRLPDAVVTLAEALAEAGYETAAFTDGGMVAGRYGFDQGFEIYDEEVTTEGHLRSGLAFRTPRIEQYLAGRSDADQPLFLFIHSYDIHAPYRAPEPYERTFSGQSFEELEEELGYPLELGRLNRWRNKLTPSQIQAVRGLYDNGILATDAMMGRLFELLEMNGLYSDAIVIVLSDHGEEFMEHGRFNHGKTVYGEMVEVPLLIRLPQGKQAGRVVEEPVALIDVAPTILELAGIAPVERFAGRSLVTAMAGGDVDGSADGRRIYFDIPNIVPGLEGMSKGPWKLIHHLSSGQLELYHLEDDPDELHDLAGEREELAQRLSLELSAWVDQMEEQGRSNGWHSIPGNARLSKEQEERLRALGYPLSRPRQRSSI